MPSSIHPHPGWRRRGSSSLGFTLVEMMVVVCIIGIFAALATPSVLSLLKDQRTRRDASGIMNVYRAARARSLGRGGAVLVHMTAGGVVNTYEALDNALPDPSCATAWDKAYATGTGARLVDGYKPATTVSGEPYVIITGFLLDGTKAAVAAKDFDVCYTSTGRVFYRQSSNLKGSFLPFTDQLFRVDAQRNESGTATGQIRSVFISGDGSARLSL